MPMWCRYCHQDGHTKFTCENSKARILCYSCHEQGHRSYECPRKNSANIPNKKQDRKTNKISERKDVKNIPSTDSPPPKGDQSPATQEKNAQANELIYPRIERNKRGRDSIKRLFYLIRK
ncbi:hypothetical protein G6F64_013555 [Rhizopus arrhizus]|uniref:CCHC-type domain-containing protein n=1 Tax=Rhizopus oryzae TaxID=64495 RepID=A0A9P6WV54_RHIOR|nr:hypothetical protein G6F64_013555 [Rhizopus arrhizus]